MIIPARWYAGGKGLDAFRMRMLTDKHLTHLVDYPDSKDCFPGVDIAGGICYFLRDRDREVEKCNVITVEGGEERCAQRQLDEFPTFIRDARAVAIVNKVAALNEPTMDSQVSSRKPFGLPTTELPKKTGDLILRYIGGEGPYPSSAIKTGTDLIGKWKVVASYVSFDHAGRANKEGKRKVLSVMRVLPPKTVCTETYLVYGAYETELEALNLKRYLSCKLPRSVIAQLSSGQHLTKGTFALCPIPDVSREWTDEMLFDRYSLDADERKDVLNSIMDIEFNGVDSNA